MKIFPRGQKKWHLIFLVLLNTYTLSAQRLDKIPADAKNQPFTILVDFSKHIDSVRLWVYSNRDKKNILSSKCAHGINSGYNYANSFSNEPNTNKSSLGTYLILNSYLGYYGKSWSLKGLSESNSNALKRLIVIHSSQKMKSKWSWGCFSVPQTVMDKLNNLKLKNCYLIAYR